MKLKSKLNKSLIIVIVLMSLISFFSVKSASILLNYEKNLIYKQILWYITGIILSYTIVKIGNKNIYKNYKWLYLIGNLLLIALLLFASPINNSKCWFSIGPITIQPSEFMKIILIITLANIIDKFNKDYKKHSIKNEFIFLIKIGFIVLIPSILTFLEPDTGVVIIYFIITISMLYIAGIRKEWFFIMFGFILTISIGMISFYKLNTDLFIDIFGTSFFLRMDRLFDWSLKDGYQLNQSLAAIGSAGFTGFGFNHTPIYFPEADTDFIFSVLASNKGFIGAFLLIILIIILDIILLITAIKAKNNIDKYTIAGILGMIMYQQFQNIGMTIGLIPITGITLPFISYGGSSLLSYMIILGITLNIKLKSQYKK